MRNNCILYYKIENEQKKIGPLKLRINVFNTYLKNQHFLFAPMLCFDINFNTNNFTVLTQSKYLENYRKYSMFGKYILKTFFCREMY